MKKIISIILSVTLVLFSIVPAFAAVEDDFAVKYQEFLYDVTECEDYYIYYGYDTPTIYPSWSSASTERMKDAISYARERTITNNAELEIAYADLEEVATMMCVDKSSLEFMIYLFEQETNVNNYYDDDTWNDFRLLLEKGEQAFESNDEKLIHKTYIEMRNSYNNLCIYNTVKGDFNGDGRLSIADVTYAQKYLADLVEFNSSQEMLSKIKLSYTSGLNIESVTKMQKYIIGLETDFTNEYLDNLMAYDEIAEDAYYFTIIDEQVNIVYSLKYDEYRFGDIYNS